MRPLIHLQKLQVRSQVHLPQVCQRQEEELPCSWRCLSCLSLASSFCPFSSSCRSPSRCCRWCFSSHLCLLVASRRLSCRFSPDKTASVLEGASCSTHTAGPFYVFFVFHPCCRRRATKWNLCWIVWRDSSCPCCRSLCLCRSPPCPSTARIGAGRSSSSPSSPGGAPAAAASPNPGGPSCAPSRCRSPSGARAPSSSRSGPC